MGRKARERRPESQVHCRFHVLPQSTPGAGQSSSVYGGLCRAAGRPQTQQLPTSSMSQATGSPKLRVLCGADSYLNQKRFLPVPFLSCSSSLEEIRLIQKQRERTKGIPAGLAAAAVGPAKAEEEAGGEDAGRGEELVLQDTFVQESETAVEDPNM